MNLEIIFKGVFVGAGAIVGYLFGGWSIMLQILVTLIVIDYLSGLLASSIEGGLSSKIGFKGIAKKVMIFFIIAVAHMTDLALGGHTGISEAAMIFYIANEMVSIFENAGRMGVPLPDKLMNAVAVLKGKKETK